MTSATPMTSPDAVTAARDGVTVSSRSKAWRTGTGQIEALTSLRAFAALFVVVFHHGQAQFATAPAWLQNVVNGGFVGVPFFFILSGFILTYNYLPQAEAQNLDYRRFWLARFARIYPAYVVSLLLSAPLFLAGLLGSLDWPAAVGRFILQGLVSFGLLQSWIPDWSFAWNGPAWSLSVEACFYLAFPFLVKLLSGTDRLRLLAGLALAAISLVAISWLVPSWRIIPRIQDILGWANPVLWLPLFLLGICAGEWHLRRAARMHECPARRSTVLALGAVALIGVALAANLHRFSHLLFCYGLALPCTFLIVLLAEKFNALSRLLSGTALVRLGEASFGLYILHRPVQEWFARLDQNWPVLSIQSTLGFTIYLVSCVGISLVSLRFVEGPCRTWINSRWSGWPGKAQRST